MIKLPLVSTNTLYNQESEHQILLAFQTILEDFPLKIAQAISTFATDGESTSMEKIYKEILTTTERLTDLEMTYRIPEPIEKTDAHTPTLIRRLWTEEERDEQQLDYTRTEMIEMYKSKYHIDLSDSSRLPSELLHENIYYGEYFTHETLPPYDPIKERARPTDFSACRTFIDMIDPQHIAFPVNGLTELLAPECSAQEFTIADTFFTDGVKKYPIPPIQHETRRAITTHHIQEHIDRAAGHGKAFLRAVIRRLDEYKTLRSQQESAGVRDNGDITTKQIDTLLNLIRANQRLSREERIAVSHVIPVMSVGNAKSAISALIREAEENRR